MCTQFAFAISGCITQAKLLKASYYRHHQVQYSRLKAPTILIFAVRIMEQFLEFELFGFQIL